MNSVAALPVRRPAPGNGRVARFLMNAELEQSGIARDTREP